MKPTVTLRKYLAYPLSYYYKFWKWNRQSQHNRFLILMFHRIAGRKNSDSLLQYGMYVEPETFQTQINYLKNNFFIVSLDKILSQKRFDGDQAVEKPTCVLTFDDGWKDFYENAYPVLRLYDACATVFLPTDFIGTAHRFWTDRLAFILCKMSSGGTLDRGNKRSFNKIVEQIERTKGSADDRLEEAVKILKSLPNGEIENVLDELKEKWNVKDKMRAASFLSWEEAKEMHRSGFIRFGSHTKSHRILTTISEDEIREELTRSKEKLIEEGLASSSFIPFAYPNGNYNDRIAKLVEEAGYHLAITTERGWNRITDLRRELYRLKRVGIHQDMTSTNSMLACRIHGTY